MAITTMAEPLPDGALFDLMTWTSPAWPIGAFAYSSGLEWAVDQGLVADRAGAARWLGTLLEHGPIHNDSVVFVHAWRAAHAGDTARLWDVAGLSAAAQTGCERRLEATAQGAAFRRIARTSLDDPSRACLGAEYARLLAPVTDADLTYPIAAATLFACAGIALRPALTAYLHGVVANLVSAAQRLVPLGQTDGQRVLRDLAAPILAAIGVACNLADGDPFTSFAGAALLADLGCMAHETQYTRLFRT